MNLRYFNEAVAAVALSHRVACACDTCAAAKGDLKAFTRMLVEVVAFRSEGKGERTKAAARRGLN